MKTLSVRIAALPFLLVFLNACGLRYSRQPDLIVWRGEVEISEDVELPRGSRLIIEPGATIKFAFRDDDNDGWGDASLKIGGTLTALGTPEAPIVFTSENQPAKAGQWGEIRVDFGAFDLGCVIIEGSTRGLHSHFSRGRIRDSIFRNNIDGTRLGESTATIEHCLFNLNAGKGYNSRKSRNLVRRNIFRQNQNGVFLFEADTGSLFEENIFIDNKNSMRLGDFFQGTVKARGNDWGGSEPVSGVDAEDEAEAAVETDPGKVSFAGVRAWPLLQKSWKTSVSASPKARPVIRDEGVYVKTASGGYALLGFLNGSISQQPVNPPKKKTRVHPRAGDELYYHIDEQGRTAAIAKTTGAIAWTRDLGAQVMGEPVKMGEDAVFIATAIGKAVLLDKSSGAVRDVWNLAEGEPSLPVEAGSRTYIVDASGDVWAFDARALSYAGIRFGEANSVRQFDQRALELLGPKH